MDSALKEKIRETVEQLPAEELPELMDFLRYLVWRAGQAQPVAGSPAQRRQDDPLVGLFEGPADLAEEAENLLASGAQSYAGWTWKSPKL